MSLWRASWLAGVSTLCWCESHFPHGSKLLPPDCRDPAALSRLVCVVTLPGELQDVGERAGLLPRAALLAHAPVARHQEGQAKYYPQPNHDKQRHKPLRRPQPCCYQSYSLQGCGAWIALRCTAIPEMNLMLSRLMSAAAAAAAISLATAASLKPCPMISTLHICSCQLNVGE